MVAVNVDNSKKNIERNLKIDDTDQPASFRLQNQVVRRQGTLTIPSTLTTKTRISREIDYPMNHCYGGHSIPSGTPE